MQALVIDKVRSVTGGDCSLGYDATKLLGACRAWPLDQADHPRHDAIKF